MQLKGHKEVETTPEVCYGLLTDPEVLVRTMPGLKRLEPQGENRYQADLEMGVAAIRGKYAGTVVIEEPVVGQSYRLLMEGQGSGGFVNVDMVVRFQNTDSGCDIQYEGEAKIGGTVAGVGQRMLSGVAAFIVNQFFGNIAKEVQRAQG